MKNPITDKIPRLRQRARANGSWRIWWEPETAIRPLGFAVTELDEKRLTWSIREAKRLNKDVDTARVTGAAPSRASGDRSMSALITTYTHGRRFKKLAIKTQASYRSNLKLIDEKWGETSVLEFSKPIIVAWYETNYECRGKTQAVALNRMLSILFEFAETHGWRPENTNPARRIGAEIPKGRRRQGTWEETDALIEAAETLGWHNMAIGIGLSLYQGQRQTDVFLAKPTDFEWGNILKDNTLTSALIWTLRRSKRQNMGTTPIHAEISLKLAQLLLERDDDAPALLIDESTRKPYDANLFGKRFRAIRDEAAKKVPSLRDVQFRDLRRTFAKRAREGGSTIEDTADVLGNSAAKSPQLAEIYMASQLATTTRAVNAVTRPKGDT
ncbi:tyrosine-type recombinase/integrase [Pacificibacter marinus]|uniref:tyrosine-type recombinase/integrase n=1 Tax=Pacificibacter marinus TaxID=658057 RepID=UPI001C071A79|nr:hypothetical protein [Pacificibacter marinus]MBU2867042.1 hypothetical protein [Pacificibacter marinus]